MSQANLERTFGQFLKFCLVGVSNTAVAYLTYLAVVALMGAMVDPTNQQLAVAQTVSFVVSVAWSFALNNHFVFEAKGAPGILGRLAKTYVSYSITGLFLSTALLILWTQTLHVPVAVAPLINLVITVPLNFLLNKYWAFRSIDG